MGEEISRSGGISRARRYQEKAVQAIATKTKATTPSRKRTAAPTALEEAESGLPKQTEQASQVAFERAKKDFISTLIPLALPKGESLPAGQVGIKVREE